jgi:hypothetical protein
MFNVVADPIRLHPVVRIEKYTELSGRSIEELIENSTYSPVLFIENERRWLTRALDPMSDPSNRPIGRTVVDNDEFEIAVTLTDDRIKGLLDEVLVIETRNEDTDKGFGQRVIPLFVVQQKFSQHQVTWQPSGERER